MCLDRETSWQTRALGEDSDNGIKLEGLGDNKARWEYVAGFARIETYRSTGPCS